MKEEWKVIKDYPNYSISNTQKVKNNKTGRILKAQGTGAVTLCDRSHNRKANKGILSLYLKYFEGFPMDRNARTKILNEDTGEIYYGYKAACEALGVKYDGSSNIRAAIYKKNNSGTDKTAYGYHFDEIY